MKWVGFGWYHERDHDYLLDPQDQASDSSRWIGWWRSSVEHRSAEEIRLFEKACAMLSPRARRLVDRSPLDSEPQHAGGWPYFHGVSAAGVADALRVDTNEFAAAASKLLPEIRRAVDQVS
jgi:hypothetical protein